MATLTFFKESKVSEFHLTVTCVTNILTRLFIPLLGLESQLTMFLEAQTFNTCSGALLREEMVNIM